MDERATNVTTAAKMTKDIVSANQITGFDPGSSTGEPPQRAVQHLRKIKMPFGQLAPAPAGGNLAIWVMDGHAPYSLAEPLSM